MRRRRTPPSEYMPRSRTHYVCFACRRSVKYRRSVVPRTEPDTVRCPQCGQPMTDMGRNFKPPPRRQTRQWRKVALLAAAGIRFTGGGGSPVGRVRTLAQARPFVADLRAAADRERGGDRRS